MRAFACTGWALAAVLGGLLYAAAFLAPPAHWLTLLGLAP
jgi:hypothetical protein